MEGRVRTVVVTVAALSGLALGGFFGIRSLGHPSSTKYAGPVLQSCFDASGATTLSMDRVFPDSAGEIDLKIPGSFWVLLDGESASANQGSGIDGAMFYAAKSPKAAAAGLAFLRGLGWKRLSQKGNLIVSYDKVMTAGALAKVSRCEKSSVVG